MTRRTNDIHSQLLGFAEKLAEKGVFPGDLEADDAQTVLDDFAITLAGKLVRTRALREKESKKVEIERMNKARQKQWKRERELAAIQR